MTNDLRAADEIYLKLVQKNQIQEHLFQELHLNPGDINDPEHRDHVLTVLDSVRQVGAEIKMLEWVLRLPMTFPPFPTNHPGGSET